MDNWPVWLQSPMSAGFISGLIVTFIFLVIPAMKGAISRSKEYAREEEIKNCQRRLRISKFQGRLGR